jgi:Bacterial Ig-like domain (group 3)
VTSNSSPAYPVTVGQDGTTAVVTSSVSKPVYGQSVTLTAKVTASAPGSGTPTGMVTFYDGITSLGTATLKNGAASINTTPLEALHDDIAIERVQLQQESLTSTLFRGVHGQERSYCPLLQGDPSILATKAVEQVVRDALHPRVGALRLDAVAGGVLVTRRFAQPISPPASRRVEDEALLQARIDGGRVLLGDASLCDLSPANDP